MRTTASRFHPGVSSDDALLIEGLQVRDRLRDDSDKLAHDLVDIGLGERALLLHLVPIRRAPERRLELWPSLLTERLLLQRLRKRVLLPKPAAVHRGCRRRRVPLQRRGNLRNNREDLPHHLVDILLRQQALWLTITVTHGLHRLRLREDLRQ